MNLGKQLAIKTSKVADQREVYLSPRVVGPRPRHHPGRSCFRPPAVARSARLPRRNRRTLPSVGWDPARLSGRCSAARPNPAAGRIRRPPSSSFHLGAETKTYPAAHLQSFRPSRFGGRYLNVKGVTESRCSYGVTLSWSIYTTVLLSLTCPSHLRKIRYRVIGQITT